MNADLWAELEEIGTYAGIAAVLDEGAKHGVGLVDVLRRVVIGGEMPPDEPAIDIHGDWLAELVDVVGLEATEAAFREAGRAIDIQAQLRLIEHTAHLRALLAAGDIDAVLDADGPAWMAAHWLDHAALEAIIDRWQRFPADLLADRLERRFPAIDLWVATADRVGPRVADERLVTGDWLSWWLAEHLAHGWSLWTALPRVEQRHTLEEWLPAMVAAGFQPSFAALACLERGRSVPETAVALVAAGIASERVFDALSECGAGPFRVLRELHEAQWSPAVLVAMSRAGGLMDTEIRARLAELRVPEVEIHNLMVPGTITWPDSQPRS